jgi:hypothetical protein
MKRACSTCVFHFLTFSSRGVLPLALLSALLLMGVRPAQGQTETVLYNFCSQPNCSDGGVPGSGLTFHGGNLYGTTLYDGVVTASGNVFELSPNGSGGWTETVLYPFSCTDSGQDCPDGGAPASSVIFDSKGNLYGTTSEGGNDNCGTTVGCGVAFELSPVGAGWAETRLYAFCSGPVSDPCQGGWYPGGSLVMDASGNLYGTDGSGDFELSPSAGVWTEQLITHNPSSALTMDAAGNIFGLAPNNAGQQTVFELSPNGEGGWNSSVIYTFTSVPKGDNLWSPLAIDRAGNFYGTISEISSRGKPVGGSVYKILLLYSEWTKQTIYTFLASDSEPDGNEPTGSLVLDSLGNIYGTTFQGGANNEGTVFELSPPLSGLLYKEKLLWSFNGTDGSQPNGGLIFDGEGNLYGMTSGGGSTGNGVAFEVTGITPTTATVLSSTPNPSIYGQSVTLTAVVAANFGAPPNGEMVSFMKGKTVLGTGTLSGGSASFTTSALHGGNNLLTAVYGGDSNFIGSTSRTYTVQVSRATTATTLISSQNPSNAGQSVTFTATVAPEFSGTPTGTVSFSDGTTVLKTVGAGKGVAKYTTKTLASGAHNITATYNTSPNFVGSTGSLMQTVNP